MVTNLLTGRLTTEHLPATLTRFSMLSKTGLFGLSVNFIMWSYATSSSYTRMGFGVSYRSYSYMTSDIACWSVYSRLQYKG